MKASDNIEAKGVKGADPHRCGGLLVFLRNAVGHLAGGLVGEGEHQDAPRIDALGKKHLHPGRQGLRLAGAWSGFEQVGPAPPIRSGLLFFI